MVAGRAEIVRNGLEIGRKNPRESSGEFSYFPESKRLVANNLSRRQSEKEQCYDGRVGMHGASNSAAYYRNREQAERMQAARAVSDNIRQIHLTMAERYRELAEQSGMASAEPPI